MKSHIQKLIDILKTDIQFLKGVGPKKAKNLKKSGINTIEDLLLFIPKDYEDKRRLKKISELRPEEFATLKAKVWIAGVSKNNIFEVIFRDETGVIKAKWFNFNTQGFLERFKEDREFILSGRIRYNRFERMLEIIHPQTKSLSTLDKNFFKIHPIYPNIEGLQKREIVRLIENAISLIEQIDADFLPDYIIEKLKFPRLSDALKEIHFPQKDTDVLQLKRKRSQQHIRIIFNEFFPIQTAIALTKSTIKREPGISFKTDSERLTAFIKRLPFKLTKAQERVLNEIKRDMNEEKPMNRLIQGDVGCGKTIIAICAALIAIDNGYQVAFMAPTEILSEQHFFNIKELLKGMNINISILTSSLGKREKDLTKNALKSGAIDIIVGTHALIQENVSFKKLGLVIIDEQHRFGVLQRKKLREKGQNCDLIVMTATPIPRTLALTVYGELDISIIDELPAGRVPVKTKVIFPKDREKAYNFIKNQIKKGNQAYIVFPLIEESEKLKLPSVIESYPKIKEIFKEFNVGLLHGKMKGEEKERVMRKFKNKEIQILVCTTVVEVGVDVPDATVMLIEGAERFGLSQLHQLRGRVGRSDKRSYCLLMVSKENGISDNSIKRLKILEETTDGFKIAEEDLKIRGPGEFLGTRQSGLEGFKVANIFRDKDIMELARSIAFEIVEKDPLLMLPEHRNLHEYLKLRGYLQKIKLIESG